MSSFGIALAEYHDVTSGIVYHGIWIGGFGLSWVTVWVLLFTVVVPASPRRALVAASLSASAVPLAFGLNAFLGSNTVALDPFEFFFTLVFPNMLVVAMAYVGARVVYRLGTAVRKARELGSYRLTERLGRGGMGEVWCAEHRLLARPAAVKLVRPEVLGGTDPSSRQVLVKRFEREAQVTALMRSPHTMQLYDFGLTHDGTFYYVMELLDGFDLDELVTRFGPVPAERAVHLLVQICDSLAEAHGRSVVGRRRSRTR